MKKELIEKILQETETGYDLIADKFSQTRNKKFWSDLEFIRDYAKDGDKILDFGCGNGRLLELFSDKNIEYFGTDVSEKFIDIAQRKYYANNINFQKLSSLENLPRTKATNKKDDTNCEAKAIEKEYSTEKFSQRLVRGEPFPDNYFNTAYSIAAFHHLPGKDIRVQTAKELFRVLQPGGTLLITVWNLWQKKYRKNIFQNWMRKIIGRSNLDWNDCYISFKDNQGNVFQRYHHAYTKKELQNIFEKAGFEVEKCELIGNVNIVAILRKK